MWHTFSLTIPPTEHPVWPFHSIPFFIPFHICPVTAGRVTDEEQPSRDERCLYGSRTHLSHPINGHSVMMCHMTIPFHSISIPFHFIPFSFQHSHSIPADRAAGTDAVYAAWRTARTRQTGLQVCCCIHHPARAETHVECIIVTLSKFDLAHTIHKSTHHVM